jgi:hypothetical protein
MQLIDMPTGRYCIADGRDLGAFLRRLKRPVNRNDRAYRLRGQ